MEKKEPIYQKLVIDDTVYETILTEKYLKRKPWKPANPKHVLSILPGTVRKIYVKENQKVEVGKKLFVLEAMKMHNTILSPVEGVVKCVNISVDEAVPKSYLMIEFE